MHPTESSAVNSTDDPRVNTRAVLGKALILLALAVAGAMIYYTTPVKDYFDKAGPVSQWFRALGGLGMVVFILGEAVLILLGVPRLLLCPVAGALYGFWIGLAVSLAGTMISYYIGFIWIRGRQHHGLNRTALPRQLAFLAGDPGISGVIIGRLVPAPGMLVTMALALSNVSDGAYLLGSAIGLIPEAVPAVLAGVMQDDFGKWGKMAGIAFLCLVVAWLLIHYVSRRFALQKALRSVDIGRE